jgi:hypothetical protein
MMASGGDHDRRSCGGSPCRDGHQLSSHRARTDASSSRASPSVRWVFTLCRCLPGLASCHDVDLHLLVGVGLCLLQMWWSSSCRGSSLLGRGSWTVGKAPMPFGRMDWWLLNAPSKRCAQSTTPATSRPRLSSSTSLLSHTPLVPGPNGPPTSTRHWRSVRSSFACRRQTWRCKWRCWQRSKHAAYIPLTGGTCWWNWKRPVREWMRSTASVPLRPGDYSS